MNSPIQGLKAYRPNQLTNLFPSWQQAIYIVNPSQNSVDDPKVLTTPLNKGHEAMAYLTYIIEHYSSLPATNVFLHPHRSGFLKAWHVDAPLHDNAISLQTLQLPFIQQAGYVNLRCNWNPGCTGARRNLRVLEYEWNDLFSNTSTPPLNETETGTETGEQPPPEHDGIDPEQKQMHLNPKRLAAPCCAQFAVSRNQILKRPVDDYVHFRQWLIDTPRDDAASGRIMEYMWHVIFGKDSVLYVNNTSPKNSKGANLLTYILVVRTKMLAIAISMANVRRNAENMLNECRAYAWKTKIPYVW